MEESQAAMKQCPYCAETIKAAAILCRFCNRDLPPSGTMSVETNEATSEPEAPPAYADPTGGQPEEALGSSDDIPARNVVAVNEPNRVQSYLWLLAAVVIAVAVVGFAVAAGQGKAPAADPYAGRTWCVAYVTGTEGLSPASPNYGQEVAACRLLYGSGWRG